MNSQEIDLVLDELSKIFYPLSQVTKDSIKGFVTLKQIPANTVIVKEGQYSDLLFYIVKGSMRAYYQKEDKNITDWFAFEKEFMCALNSYHQQIPSDHYIETIEDSQLLIFKRENVKKLCDNYVDFERLTNISIINTLLEMKYRMVSLQFESAQEKYQKLIIKKPDISLRVPLGYIASYLGITQETLSRLRNPKKPNLI